MKKVIAGLTAGLLFTTSLAFAIPEDSICKICVGSEENSGCTVYHLPAEMIHPFIQATWIKLDNKGVKEWYFECSVKPSGKVVRGLIRNSED